MLVKNLAEKRQQVERLLADPHALPGGDLAHVAATILAEREALLTAVQDHPTPLYLYDGPGYRRALREFTTVFAAALPAHQPFYAVKSNHHPAVVAEAVAQGFGLDVSSGRELRQALQSPATAVLFSGPAKSLQDLELAVTHAERVTVNLDSFGELAKLGQVTQRLGRSIRAGVRIFTDHHGDWSKFGIALRELPRFFRQAAEHPGVALQGVQFHLSWNRDALPYQRIIADLAEVLARELSPAERAQISFIDIGGGYRPHRLEGYYPKDHPLGAVIAAASDHYGTASDFVPPYLVKDSIPVSEYAAAIGAAIDRHLRPLVNCSYYTEPGRIVSTYAMHIALRVVDKKSDELVIVDGGINMVGWERYLHIYCPMVNLTRPALRELPLRVAGSLCDCEDIWGFHCYAESVEEGDILLVPYQGAYTFATAQEFIRAIPEVFPLAHPE